MSRRVLGVFAKRPVAGFVKTRLAAETSPAFAAEAAEAFLHDTLRRVGQIAERSVVVFAPDSADAYFADLAAAHGAEAQAQGEGDLGERLFRFFQGEGHVDRVVVIGSDSPSVPVEYVEQAFGLLEDREVVIGPATDGGYYLLGCRGRFPELFEGIPWSGPTVFSETVRRVRGRLGLLPPWHDVDTLADVQLLRAWIAARREAGLDPGLPRTESLLVENPGTVVPGLSATSLLPHRDER
jgi:rSAM/selenodomain-associated transferase 1